MFVGFTIPSLRQVAYPFTKVYALIGLPFDCRSLADAMKGQENEKNCRVCRFSAEDDCQRACGR
jgi:hypothetical protein